MSNKYYTSYHCPKCGFIVYNNDNISHCKFPRCGWIGPKSESLKVGKNMSKRRRETMLSFAWSLNIKFNKENEVIFVWRDGTVLGKPAEKT